MPPTFASLPLPAVRAFEAAARLGGMKAAAAELGVTPAAVSHQIKALERYLGAALFERRHRAVAPTAAGLRLAAAARNAFDGLRGALDALSDAGLIAGPATLTISAAPSLAAKWLAPRLHRFQAARPDIALRLSSDEALDDPGGDRRIDVALRYGPGPTPRRFTPNDCGRRGW